MKVVLAEKPSVARDLARVLGCREKERGFFSGAGYAVTWVLGHLVEIAEPSSMDKSWGVPWKSDELPMVPAPWKYAVTEKGGEQFAVIRRLFTDDRTSEIIAATDAGREGELIFRLMYELTGSNKPVKRLWIRSLTDEAIREGFESLEPASSYDALAESARTRSHADWLLGLNFTRAYTLHNHELCTIGRVQTPTLALVVERQNAIEHFVPEAYYEVHAVIEPGFTAKYSDAEGGARIKDKAEAERVLNAIEPVSEADVTSCTMRDVRVPAPPLFDLLTLQKEANQRFGFTAAKSLQVAQALYEKHKLITYPRTESRHLSSDLLPTLPNVLDALAESYPTYLAETKLSKAYVDDTKITDHHAILPTNTPADGLELSEDERCLYDLIARRFLAIFLRACVRSETAAEFLIAGHRFTAKGSTVPEPGWTVIAPPDDAKAKNEALPLLKEGETCEKRTQSLESKKTRPPKPYTDATLLDAMKKAGAQLSDRELAAYLKRSGLGTAATRAAIIERLLKSRYIERKKRTLVPTTKGTALVNQVLPELTDPALTAQWEQRLEDIEEGKADGARFENDLIQLIRKLLPKVFESKPIEKPELPTIGECPLCDDGKVRESPKAFGCSRWREGCRFTIWKAVAGKMITAEQAHELLEKGRTGKLKGFKTKSGHTFNAALVLNDRNKLEFAFS